MNDLKFAVRQLLKNPGFTAVAVLTLALGIGANTAIFSVLHAVVLRDLPYPNSDRLALLWTLNLRQNLPDGSSYLNFRDWKEQSREFEEMAVYRRPEFTQFTITDGPEPERVHCALVGPGFFRVLGVPALLGRTIETADIESGHQVVVISHRLWRQRFAENPGVIGRTIEVNGVSYEIVGVMASDCEFPTSDIELWGPLSLLPIWERMQHEPRSRGADALVVFGRLNPNATLKSARLEMNTIAARLRAQYPDSNGGRGIMIEPLTDHVIGTRTKRSLWLLFGAVGFVVLIACANVANLVLARGAARRHEFSLRTALGASRARLVQQALTETLALATLAAGFGVLLAWVGADALRTWAAGALPRLETVQLDLNVLLFALAVSLTCGVLAGLLPALQLSATNPAEALREGGRSLVTHGSRRLRHGFVIAEIALAVVLLSGAGLLIRSFVRVQTADRGFDSRHVLLLGDLDADALTAVVINETMARRFWPGENAVGKRFKFGLNPGADEPWTTVVGVVADMKRTKLDEAAIPCMFWPGFGGQMDVVVRTVGDPAALRDAIRAELHALDPATPLYGIVSVEQRLWESVALRKLQTLLLGTLAVVALILAVIGVYGVVHQSVVARTQEIGIRMALGASKLSVLRMILWSGAGLAGAGLGLGLIGILALGRMIASFLYETSPQDPLVHAVVVALLVVVTSVACLAPARRAMQIDPMEALRSE
jgi:cell division protein FtsX